MDDYEIADPDVIVRVCKAGHLLHRPNDLQPYPERCPYVLDPANTVKEICNQLFHPGRLVQEIN